MKDRNRYSEFLKESYGAFVSESAADLRHFSGKTVVITGASGMYGSGLVDFFWFLNQELPEMHCRIILQTREARGVETRFEELSSDFQVRPAPLLAYAGEGELGDFLFHASSPASPKDYVGHPAETVAANVEFTGRVLARMVAAKKGHFVFISSGDVYGQPSENFIPTPEDYPGNIDLASPRSVYAESKRTAETLLQSYRALYQTPVTIVRPFNIYGPGQRLDDGRLIADFVRLGLERKPIELRSDGKPRRAFCYISDAVEATVRAVLFGQQGRAYNIGSAEEDSIANLAEKASEVFSLAAPRLVPPPDFQKGSHTRVAPDLTRAQTELRYRPRVDFKTGVERAFRWQRLFGVSR